MVMPKVHKKVYENLCNILYFFSEKERQKFFSNLEKIIERENPEVLKLIKQARNKGDNSVLAVYDVYHMLREAYKQQFSLLQRRKVSLPKIDENIITRIRNSLHERKSLKKAFNDMQKYNPCVAEHLKVRAVNEQNKVDLFRVYEAIVLYLALNAKFNSFDYFPKRK